MLSMAGCSTDPSQPWQPIHPPTEEEIDNLVGDWEGLTETTTGLLDLLNLTFYRYHDHIMVTVYLNNAYVDDVNVQYDGDRIWFASYNMSGEYGEFDGTIDHENFLIAGSFMVQWGISTREGTFVVYKQ